MCVLAQLEAALEKEKEAHRKLLEQNKCACRPQPTQRCPCHAG